MERPVLELYLRLTTFFGIRRRFVRRVAGLALILLGVHAAADLIDDVTFQFVDALDRAVDAALFALADLIGAVMNQGADAVAARGEAWASIIDVAEKEKVALVLALVAEIVIDLLLLDFAWGKRRAALEERRTRVVDELRESAAELKSALWPIDLERLAIVPILLLFTTTATLSAGRAVEQIASSFFIAGWPLWRGGIGAAASVGLVFALLLVWRFLPDLLHGALLRAHERGAHYESVDDVRLTGHTTLPVWRRRVRRAARGAVLFFVVLPLAVVSVLEARELFALVERIGALG